MHDSAAQNGCCKKKQSPSDAGFIRFTDEKIFPAVTQNTHGMTGCTDPQQTYTLRQNGLRTRFSFNQSLMM